MKRRLHPLVLILIGFALFGFGYQLIFNPGSIVRMLAVIAAVGVIIYLVVRYMMKKRMGKDYSSYAKAAKQSRKRLKKRTQAAPTPIKSIQTHKRTQKSSAIKKKRQTHLTVIEGKKGKKKNRASF
ncbi:SA1362 family protein [Metabacillus arenae]|uniref:YqhP n=1 Tax=Metabacillus arenae TaxID=2771434 RepID=A0A926RW48_9BACI|nr:SA1362 family protein [Metabacillus arenae]MBD1378812.1 hypothetical protein [Metabacillus arenae]